MNGKSVFFCFKKVDEHGGAKDAPRAIPRVLAWLFKHSLIAEAGQEALS